jgi:hypothetical protein
LLRKATTITRGIKMVKDEAAKTMKKMKKNIKVGLQF